MDLDALIAPAHTALVTMELQRGVVGDLAALPDLRAAAQAVGLADRAGALCAAAREVDATVAHCTVAFRSDRRGSTVNAPILAAAEKLTGDRLDAGMAGTELIPEIGDHPHDLVVPRTHGLTPMVASDLDQLLRNCGVRTVVAVGASLNVGLTGLVLAAVDLGYQVVVPRDAVVGVPVEYGDAVIRQTISLLATVVTADDVMAAWS